MLLFQRAFHEGLVSGAITLTFRNWPKPKVKAGGRYRCHPIGVLEVSDVRRVAIGSIDESEASRAGFEDRQALVDFLRERSPDLTDASEIYRVELRHAGDGDRAEIALDASLTDNEVELIREKLKKYDERGGDGPWTQQTLELIENNPRVVASKLAKSVGRERAAFKADVVKLKKLGLTQSFEIGYEISPRGRAYLERVRLRIGETAKRRDGEG